MWVRKRIDIGWVDLLSAVANCFRFSSRTAASRSVEAVWSADGLALACLSVRSGLDLLLTALQLPAGSEVLVSAITIPDMVRILTHHGLVPVPVDLCGDDMSPRVDLLEKSVTSATRAILVAHLFGGRFDLTPIVEFAGRHGLLLLEDCAQAFDGDRYRGNDAADVSMFSFGPIKTATALGGGILRFKSDSLRNRVRDLQAQYPVQSRWRFLRRVLFYCVLKGLGGRIVFGLFFRMTQWLGKDLDQVLNGSVRNFPLADLFELLRLQPSTPLLLLMARRITRYCHADLDLRAARGQLLVQLLPVEACPGSQATPHSFWTFPVCVVEKSTAVVALKQAGFDATAQSSLRIVECPSDRQRVEPLAGKAMLESMIFLPVYSAMPESEIRRMADVLAAVRMNEPAQSMAVSD